MKYLLEGETTERLLFRKLIPADFDAWLPFHQNPLSSKHWEGAPLEPIAACKQWFQKAFHRYENNLGGMNALIDKNTGLLVGQCGLLVQTVDAKNELEVGYSIVPQYWQQGFATEAAIKCKEYAFAHKVASSLISIIHIDNIGSQKVAKNNGMHLDTSTTYANNPVHIFRVYA